MEPASGRGPDIAIIGAMKCATTTLHHLLAQHECVCTAATKELNFFSHDPRHALGLDWYLEQFEAQRPVYFRLDSSPNYTKRQHWPKTASRLSAANPGARLIYLVREPISRARSAYVHELAAGREHGSPDQVLSDHRNAITQTSRYAWQLDSYLDVFDPGQILVLRFDELVSEPLKVLNRTLQFLDLAPVDELDLDDSAQNSSGAKTMPSAMLRRIPIRRARGALRRVSPRLAERPIPAVEFSNSLELSIRDYLRPDLERLQKTGLVDVSDWIAASEP